MSDQRCLERGTDKEIDFPNKDRCSVLAASAHKIRPLACLSAPLPSLSLYYCSARASTIGKFVSFLLSSRVDAACAFTHSGIGQMQIDQHGGGSISVSTMQSTLCVGRTVAVMCLFPMRSRSFGHNAQRTYSPSRLLGPRDTHS